MMSPNGVKNDKDDDDDIPTAMSTSALETKLKEMKEKSNKHSQILTAKLASSQSGQNLLHIGTSLSTLPPDLHSLLTQLHPVLSAAESTEKNYLQNLQKLVKCGHEIRVENRRVENAKECANIYHDLIAAEIVVKKEVSESRRTTTTPPPPSLGLAQSAKDDDIDESGDDQLDRISSLERCAHTTLCLIQDLQISTDKITALTASKVVTTTSGTDDNNNLNSTASLPSMRTPLQEDTERAQFVMKLAPRIRRLESDTIISLTHRMEKTLRNLQLLRDGGGGDGSSMSTDGQQPQQQQQLPDENDLLLMLGNCMRGLALLGRGKEVESIFARVAIMPIIRSKVSMGRLDEGGPRGECAGLTSLLDEITVTVSKAFGPALRLAEAMFDVGPKMAVDLITAGVWVPIATAFIADAGIKMAIFSPGIASILQTNYIALDKFLSQLALRLLEESDDNENTKNPKEGSTESLYFRPKTTKETIIRAQDRIYAHPKTAEFSKRWNLPIYYQLRFGECCNRLNKATDETRREGWIAEVFTGKQEVANSLKADVGFELSFFLELYDILLGLWLEDVIIRPLANRFLRGSVQLVGRTVSFIQDGLSGKIKFGVEEKPAENGTTTAEQSSVVPSGRPAYCWAESVVDVAAVAWELAVLESTLSHEYVSTVCEALATDDSTESERNELRDLVSEVLKEAASQIRPVVEMAWNDLVVQILTGKCSGPLAAVKGVAATYRMTNRPPPTQSSPFVVTILRPVKEFSKEFGNRTPVYIGNKWIYEIVKSVSERYSAAVEELLTTVQRTEVALQNRRTRRAVSGGMSDGDKVKLQLYLDYQDFSRHVQELGVDPSNIEGVNKLRSLTEEAAQMNQNGR